MGIFKHSFVVASICSVFSLHAETCLRCQKIEDERAKEQATHPHQAGYYEDEIGLASEFEAGKKTPETLKPLPAPEPQIIDNNREGEIKEGNVIPRAVYSEQNRLSLSMNQGQLNINGANVLASEPLGEKGLILIVD
ncbi:MAG: hypothetical protein LW832_10830 [Parachlamydia sp.]|nr:hypothetical protein [Parachlamydia sp.]